MGYVSFRGRTPSKNLTAGTQSWWFGSRFLLFLLWWFSGVYSTRKLTWDLKKGTVSKGNEWSSNHCFSRDMFVFQGVTAEKLYFLTTTTAATTTTTTRTREWCVFDTRFSYYVTEIWETMNRYMIGSILTWVWCVRVGTGLYEQTVQKYKSSLVEMMMLEIFVLTFYLRVCLQVSTIK